MTALAVTRESVATFYTTLGTFLGVATGNPGTTTTPANEASGGTPTYARVATTWGTATDNGTVASISGSAVTLNVPPATYDFAILASAATLGAANQVDNTSITSTVLSAQGQIVLTPTRTES
jgi:hypothetical protein